MASNGELIHQPQKVMTISMQIVSKIVRGQLNYSKRNLLYCYTAHTNLTWVAQGLNGGFLDGKPMTDVSAFPLHRDVFFLFSRSHCLLHQVKIHQNVVHPKLQLFPTIMTSAGDCQLCNFFSYLKFNAI